MIRILPVDEFVARLAGRALGMEGLASSSTLEQVGLAIDATVLATAALQRRGDQILYTGDLDDMTRLRELLPEFADVELRPIPDR